MNFFSTLSANEHEWRGEAEDLQMWEAHARYVWDNKLNKTVGFVRTSSYGASTEYALLIEDV